MRLTDALALTHVPRFSIVSMLRVQSVGEHTFRTLVIFHELCERIGYVYQLEDLIYVLYHDAVEAHSGDVSGPFKHSFPKDVWDRAEVSATDWTIAEPNHDGMVYRIFKLADEIEAYTWVRANGHGPHARRVMERQYRRVDEALTSFVKVLAETSASGVARLQGIVSSTISDILDEQGRQGDRSEASR